MPLLTGKIAMRRSRSEVSRWRMLRQAHRRRIRWLEGKSCRHCHYILHSSSASSIAL